MPSIGKSQAPKHKVSFFFTNCVRMAGLKDSMLEARTRILHVEDEPLDSELVGLWLNEAGMDSDIVRVEPRDAFVSALTQGGFDIVISDYGLPSFDGLEALRET